MSAGTEYHERFIETKSRLEALTDGLKKSRVKAKQQAEWEEELQLIKNLEILEDKELQLLEDQQLTKDIEILND